ncbi:MAG TPA: A/G-specific adenine glycosylase [Bacteroidota bacterium]|nr:A/G-specific adenine glycosylase [Bacteroidota bacterium]
MKNLKSLHTAVLEWYKTNAREFPWRPSRDPYRVLISEMMSQQTQISRVVPFYTRWLKAFPTFKALASASKAVVLREWSGLGYNSRAIRLHALARIVTEDHHGRLPRSVEALLEFPGIGRYTAHAICCCAFLQNVPVVDVNIGRVLTRIFSEVSSASEMKPEKESWMLATSALPSTDVFEWNQGLMDIGATICTARSPKCALCPVRRYCKSADAPVFQMPALKNSAPHKKEPSYNGVPRRLYRGKILKLLHAGAMTEADVSAKLEHEFGAQDEEWIRHVLDELEKSRLIVRRGKKVSIAA